MAETYYAHGISAEDLRLLLGFWPKFSAEADEAEQIFIEIKDKLLNDDTEPFAWCYLYELPFKQHMIQAISAIVQGYEGLINAEQVTDWYKQVVNTPGQIGALPDVYRQIDQHFDTTELSDEDAKRMLPNIAGIFGYGMSMRLSLN